MNNMIGCCEKNSAIKSRMKGKGTYHDLLLANNIGYYRK